MHPIHHSDAFVLDTEGQGEANATVVLFTRELGLISARAQGLRKSAAKLRSHVVPYAYIEVDLVRGRGLWRLISAKTVANKVQEKPKKRASQEPHEKIDEPDDRRGSHTRAFVRLLALIERLVPSEGAPDEELFNHVVTSFSLMHDMALPKKYIDTLMLWKAVSILGYGGNDIRSEILFTLPLPDAARDMTEEDNTTLIKIVTDALHHSHL